MKWTSWRPISSFWKREVTTWHLPAMVLTPSSFANLRPLTWSCSMRWCRDWQDWKPCNASKRYSRRRPSSWSQRVRRRTSWTKPSVPRLPIISSNLSILVRSCWHSRRIFIVARLSVKSHKALISRNTSSCPCRSIVVVTGPTGWRYTVACHIGIWSWAALTAHFLRCLGCRRRRPTMDLRNMSSFTTSTGSIPTVS